MCFIRQMVSDYATSIHAQWVKNRQVASLGSTLVQAPRRDNNLVVWQEHDLPYLLELLREEYILGFVRVFTVQPETIDIKEGILPYREIWPAEQRASNSYIHSLEP